MKNIKIILLTIALLLILPVGVYAAGSIRPSTSSLSVVKGGSVTFSVSASNAVGRIDISSSNPSVATVNVSSRWMDNDSAVVTVAGVSAGTSVITVRLSDAATYDEEELTGSYTITVNVTNPQPSGGTTTPPSNNNNNSNNNYNNNTGNNLSSNNKLGSLSVEGYKLTKVDDNNYKLTVSNNVSSINVNGTAADEKAVISGIGTKELAVGENVIEIIITAESGVQNKISIRVTRRDSYYLEDLEIILKDSSTNTADITIDSNTIISSSDLTKIQKSKKIINFNVYDENKKLLYSWVVDGKTLSDIKEFDSKVKFTSDYVNKIKKTSNYAEGLYISLGNNNKLPKGIKIKLLVSDKFSDKDTVNVYFYDKGDDKLILEQQGLTVKGGYVEFEVKNNANYFITMASIEESGSTSKLNIFMIISIIEAIILIVILIIYIIKRIYHSRTKNDNIDVNEVVSRHAQVQPESTTSESTNINVCSNCGSAIPQDAKTCIICGKEL